MSDLFLGDRETRQFTKWMRKYLSSFFVWGQETKRLWVLIRMYPLLQVDGTRGIWVTVSFKYSHNIFFSSVVNFNYLIYLFQCYLLKWRKHHQMYSIYSHCYWAQYMIFQSTMLWHFECFELMEINGFWSSKVSLARSFLLLPTFSPPLPPRNM